MDFLKEQLARLVYDYSIKGKFADEQFFNTAINLCIEAFDIKDYVKDYKAISDKDKERFAGYNIGTRKITLDILKQRNAVLERINVEKRAGISSSTFETCLKVNIDVVNSIIHEIMHACQYKKCLQDEDDIQRELIELSFPKNLSIVRGNKLSKKMIEYYKILDALENDDVFYASIPAERMANISGLEFERDISKLISSSKKEKIDNYTDARLLLGKIQSYSDYSPTAFVKSINESIKKEIHIPHETSDISVIERRLKRLSKENDLSLDDRLFLGFPIAVDEEREIKRKVVELKKRL